MERPNDAGGERLGSPTLGDDALRAAPGVLGGTEGLAAALARWTADARVDDAARARARQHWLRVQSEEESSVAGVLLDLAERGRPVVIDVGEHRLRTDIVGLGADFVAGRSAQGQDVLVRLDGIDAFRTEPGGGATVGDRAPVLEVSFAAVLAPVAAERPEVLVRTRSGGTVRGQLRSASAELVHIRAAGDPPTPAWVPLDAVTLVVLEP